jgi:hypothetical protein
MAELSTRFGTGRVVAIAGSVSLALVALVAVGVALLGGDSTTPEAAAADPTASTAATEASTPRPTESPEPSPTPIVHAGILDGTAMSEAEWIERKDLLPLAVMVDNTTGAYPHAGLDRADLVYETFVEGGITRLMAVYWRQEAEKILPVRSARTPFVIWASELGAMYAHAGGAQTTNDANALGQIIEWALRDLNAFSDISNLAYRRDTERRGPYDLATSTSLLRQAAARLGHTGSPAVEPWKFREPGQVLPTGADAWGIEVDFSGRLNPWQYIQWKWDPSARRYLRFQFGGAHVDAETERQLAFATVIVMRMQTSVVDDEGHVLLDQYGEGPATVFTGGRAFEGTWKKADREARTRYYDANGEEIVFERGPIFVEAIGQQSRFAFFADAAGLPPLPEYVPPLPGSFTEDSEPTSTAAAETPTPSATPTPEDTPTPTATATPSPTAVPPPTPVVTRTPDE